jgi:hypothetical protein
MARLAAQPRFLDAAISAVGEHQAVFDAAVGLGLERGTVPPGAFALVLSWLLTGR